MAPNRYYTVGAVATTLTASLSSVTPGATGNVQVASITGYPTLYPFTLLLDWGTTAQEVVTVTQAAAGTGPYTYGELCPRRRRHSAPAHTAPTATVVHGVSARDFTDPQTHLGSTSGVHGVAGALAPLNKPAFTGGRPWYDVVAFGADPTGVADSTAAIQAAINAATGNANPQTTTRQCLGPVYLPAGTYKISSDLNILSTSGFQFVGAGANCTTLTATGTAFTNAVLYINGSLDGVYGGFQVNGTGTHQVPSTVQLTCDRPVQCLDKPNGCRAFHHR